MQIVDFTTLVRVPNQPAAVRAYTAAESDEAARYAGKAGGVVVPLPLPPPDGGTADFGKAVTEGNLSS